MSRTQNPKGNEVTIRTKTSDIYISKEAVNTFIVDNDALVGQESRFLSSFSDNNLSPLLIFTNV